MSTPTQEYWLHRKQSLINLLFEKEAEIIDLEARSAPLWQIQRAEAQLESVSVALDELKGLPSEIGFPTVPKPGLLLEVSYLPEGPYMLEAAPSKTYAARCPMMPLGLLRFLWLARQKFIKPYVHGKLHPLI